MGLVYEEIRDRMFRILRPHFWFQIRETSNDYSRALEAQIDSGAKVTYIDRFTVKLGDVVIWISNYPYAYGNVYRDPRGEEGPLPTARVRKKLKKYIEEKTKSNNDPWAST